MEESNRKKRSDGSEDESLPGPTGEFPDGKVDASDEGGIRIGVRIDPDKKLIFVEFGKQISWIAFGPSEAMAFAVALFTKIQEMQNLQRGLILPGAVNGNGE